MLPFQFLLSPCHHLRDEATQDLMAAAAEELRFLGRGGYTRPLTILPRRDWLTILLLVLCSPKFCCPHKMNSRATSRSTNRINHKSIDSLALMCLRGEVPCFYYYYSSAAPPPSTTPGKQLLLSKSAFVVIYSCNTSRLLHVSLRMRT